MTYLISKNMQTKGFSLVEMAVVLVIVGLLISGLIMPLSAQMDQRNVAETRDSLENAKQAILGFAVANGRLPCPASSTSKGIENPATGGDCSTNQDGFLPAATLGLQPIDSSGYMLDAWNNRIRYAVTTANTNAFTTSGQMDTVGKSTLAPDLRVCQTGTGVTATQCSSTVPESNYLINNAVAVIYSQGKNWATGGTGTDEAINTGGVADGSNTVFVSHVPSGTGATTGEFDDLLVWISPYILYNRMVEAGQLH